jgi:hypothetical protein
MPNNDGGTLDLGDLLPPDWATNPPWGVRTISTYIMRVIDHHEADKVLVIGLPNGEHLLFPMRSELAQQLVADLTE